MLKVNYKYKTDLNDFLNNSCDAEIYLDILRFSSKEPLMIFNLIYKAMAVIDRYERNPVDIMKYLEEVELDDSEKISFFINLLSVLQKKSTDDIKLGKDTGRCDVIISLLNDRIDEGISNNTSNSIKPSQSFRLDAELITFLEKAGFLEIVNEKTLCWLKNKQLLRELLTNEKVRGDYSIAHMERITPDLFIDTKGNRLKLAKNKVMPSLDSEKIAKFLTSI